MTLRRGKGFFDIAFPKIVWTIHLYLPSRLLTLHQILPNVCMSLYEKEWSLLCSLYWHPWPRSKFSRANRCWSLDQVMLYRSNWHCLWYTERCGIKTTGHGCQRSRYSSDHPFVCICAMSWFRNTIFTKEGCTCSTLRCVKWLMCMRRKGFYLWQ